MSKTCGLLEPLVSELSKPRPENYRCLVVCLCGVSGSGKSTLAKSILASYPSFHRLSIDAIIAERHGLYDIDYSPDRYAEYQSEADVVFLEGFKDCLRKRQDVVLDRSFYRRTDRDEYRSLVEAGGGRWILFFLKSNKDVLWRRICKRRTEGVNADSALQITEEMLAVFVEGFQEPEEENEILLEVNN